jgi:hypothetical protein
MKTRIYPAPDDEGGATAPKWESPGAEDIAAALDKAGLGETTATAPEVPGETTATEPAEAEDAVRTAPALAEKPDEDSATTPETVQTVTIKGVEYTLAEVEAFHRGYMMQSDYTKKTQALSQERQAFQREREDFEARQRAGAPEAVRPDSLLRLDDQAARLQEMLNDPEVSEPVRQALIFQQEQTQGLINELRRRDVQAREDQQVTEAMSTFDNTFSELCAKHKVTDPLDRKLLQAAILEENPDTADLTDLRASVTRIFEHTHKGLQQRIEKARREGISGLSKLPVPPTTKGGGTVPLKPDTRPPATLDDGSAPAEFEDRLNRLRGIAT